MFKVQITATFWTLLIAIPFTAAALMATAYISDHLIQISTGLALLTQTVLVKGRDLILEAELSGMLAGMLLLVAIGFATYLMGQKELANGAQNQRQIRKSTLSGEPGWRCQPGFFYPDFVIRSNWYSPASKCGLSSSAWRKSWMAPSISPSDSRPGRASSSLLRACAPGHPREPVRPSCTSSW